MTSSEAVAAAPRATGSVARRTAVRAVAAVCALSWLLVPGFAGPDVWAAWSGSPDWVPVAALEAGWGALAAAVAATLLRVALRPRWPAGDLLVLSAVSVGLVVGALVSTEPAMLLFVVLLVVQVGVLSLVAGVAPWRVPVHADWRLVVLVVLGAAVAAPYARSMAAANRDGLLPSDVTVGVDHWALQTGAVLAVLLVATVAALVPSTRVWGAALVLWCSGYIALTSLRFPDSAGSWRAPWTWVVLCWAVVFLAAAWRARPSRENPAP